MDSIHVKEATVKCIYLLLVLDIHVYMIPSIGMEFVRDYAAHYLPPSTKVLGHKLLCEPLRSLRVCQEEL